MKKTWSTHYQLSKDSQQTHEIWSVCSLVSQLLQKVETWVRLNDDQKYNA